MRTILLVVLVVLLSACASVAPEKPGQAWLVSKYAYAELLEAAADYSEICRAKPSPVREQCMPVVRRLQDYDKSAQRIQASGDMGLANGEPDLLGAATTHLEALKQRLENELVLQIAAQQARRIP